MDACDQIEPTFHVPAFVGYMGETCRRANHALMVAPAVGFD